MTLIFAFGLVFQLPVVTTLLARVGLVSSQGLADKRKYAIVAAFIAAAILTPPDPVSPDRTCAANHPSLRDCNLLRRLVERQRAANAALAEADDKKSAAGL
jgi:sec-independent protein translocase protein TatC